MIMFLITILYTIYHQAGQLWPAGAIKEIVSLFSINTAGDNKNIYL